MYCCKPVMVRCGCSKCHDDQWPLYAK